MSSLIANQVKPNKCLVSVKLFIVRTILCATVQTYSTYTTITTPSLFISAYNVFVSYICLLFFSHNCSLLCSQPSFVSANLYSSDLYSEEVQTVTSHKADWITTDHCPLCLALLYTHVFNLQTVVKVEDSLSRLLQKSCMCILILDCLTCLLLLVYLEGVRCICELCTD